MSRLPLPATVQRDSAREAKRAAMAREVMWVAIGSRIWPTYLFRPSKPQPSFPVMVCIQSPAGDICYRLTEDELSLFEHVTDRREVGPKDYAADDKIAALLHLASEGWE